MTTPTNLDTTRHDHHGVEEIITESQTYYQTLLRDIQQATRSIALEVYVYANDSIGIELTTRLVAAAKRGVNVRVLVDGAGTPTAWHTLANRLELAGVKTKVFHPFPWQVWNWARSTTRLPRLMKWLYLIFKANSRNHRKSCIIDQHIAYVGSYNIVKSHLPLKQGGSGWRDTAVRLRNVDMTPLLDAFDAAWHQRKLNEQLQQAFQYVRRNPRFRLNYNRHRRRVLHKNLLRIVARCRKRIWITNAYFVPDTHLLRRLKTAAALGVDVRIMLPLKSNHFFIPWASACFYQSLLKAGVRIFEYTPSMLHAKVLILDDWMTVGSSNLNQRSLLHDLEIDVNIKTPTAKAMLEQAFQDDLRLSEELTLTTWLKRSTWQRFMGRLTLWLKYWI